MVSKEKLYNFFSFMILLNVLLPVVSNNLPPVIGSYHLYAFFFSLTVLLFDYRILFKKEILSSFLIFGLILLIFPTIIWIYQDEWNRMMQVKEFYDMIIPLLMVYVYNENKFYESYRKLVGISILFILITCLTSINASFIDPMYARELVGNYYMTENELSYFQKIGGAQYGFAISIMIILPFIHFFLKNNFSIKYSKFAILSFGLLIFFTLIRMQIFANVVISLLIVIVVIAGIKKLIRNAIILSIILIILLFVPVSVYIQILIELSLFFETDSQTYYKLTDLAEFLTIGASIDDTTGAGYRLNRYPELFKAFANSPFFGSDFNEAKYYDVLGGHLHWMNKLATMGILGLILFLKVFYNHLKYFLHKVKNNPVRNYYILSFVAFFLYGMIKTISGREGWLTLFFIIPGIYIYSNGKK